MLALKLLLLAGLVVSGFSQGPSAAHKAEIAKLRSELNKALEENDGAPEGVVVAPAWTQHDGGPPLPKTSQVEVNDASLRSAAALRHEIQQAVQHQGQTHEVVQLQAELKDKSQSQATWQEVLGAAASDEDVQPNVVESNSQSGIDLEQLQRLELSKRRTRDMLVLSRIEELFNVSMPSNVDRWLTLQTNGSGYIIGQQMGSGFLVFTKDFQLLQSYVFAANVTSMLGLERWSAKKHIQEGILVISSENHLIWLLLEPGKGLVPFWQWPLGGEVTKISSFNLDGRDYLVLGGNHILSIYAYDLETEEFWIAQRLQLADDISDLAVLDAGRELLLAVGQTNETLIYAWKGSAGELRQRVESPLVTGITAFQMGGRSYLALGGQKPRILVYLQGQLFPRTILGQNFGFVEKFLPVPVRSYRDDLLLLVQHRVFFEPHSLLVLEVLVWNGEAFEAGLPPPCGATYGANCLLDQVQDIGIQGAALLRQLDQPPLVLVPRNQASSSIFRLETQLLARNSETQDLQEIHQFMKDWVGEQDKLLLLAESLNVEDELIYEEVATNLVISAGGSIEELLVNEIAWTGADAVVDLNELIEQIRLLEEELSPLHRSKRQVHSLNEYHYERLEVDAIEAEDLVVDQLNNLPMFIQNSTLKLPPEGRLNVQRLEVLEAPREEEASPALGNETHETLKLTGDLEFSSINGLEWKQLLQDLVWRNEPLRLNQLIVEGPVIIEDTLQVTNLNDLSFPGDYLWSQGNETSVVQAPKEFSQTLSANVVDTSGSINGKNPLDAITLSDAQDWPGWVTFSQLEVAEQLELNGTAQGRQFEEAPLNPTLLESHNLHADCHFDQLLVEGSLRLLGKLEDDTFDSLLGDLVQRSSDPHEEIQVDGVKRVDQLVLPVDSHVLDNQLSGLPLERFVTKHSAQILPNLTQIYGYVYFHQLELAKGSTYDGVDLEKLLAESIRLDGSSPLPSSPLTRLRFESPPELSELHVSHTLNQVPLASGYQLLHESLHLMTGNFTHLAAEQAQVNKDVTGRGLLNGKNLENLLKEEPHTWSGDVHVQELLLPRGVQAKELQGIKADLLLDFLQQLDDLPLLILQGKLQVDQMAVTGGSVMVEQTLNGRDWAELQRQVVWLDRPNELRTRWTLQEAPDLQGNLHILGSFNDRLLPELLDDIVFRPQNDQEEVLIEGTKSFRAPIQADSLQLAALNGVPFEKLATREQKPLILTGNVQLQGRLFVEDLRLQGDQNESFAELERLLRWDPTRQNFIQRGVVPMPGNLSLDGLTVMGHLGNLSREPLEELFGQLIFKQQPRIQLQGHKTFTGRVRIDDGAFVGKLNGLDVEQLLSQLILVNAEQEEVTVETPLVFEAPVKMDFLAVERLVLQGQLLNGCNVTEWLLDTLRVDRDWQGSGVTFSQGSLDGNHLEVEQLNDLDLSQVVTLHTEQELTGPLIADEVLLKDGLLSVQGTVNGRNLSEDYDNTLMTYPLKPQQVDTPLFLSGINVSGSLETTAPIKGINLSDVATLGGQEPLLLQSPLYFAQLHAPFLKAGHPLNGFRFEDWYQKSLWARGRNQQEITGSWRVNKLRVKQPEMDNQRLRRQTVEEGYWNLCQQLARILQLPYQVQKLKKAFTLKQLKDQGGVRRVFAVEADESSHYLLVNELGCWTRIYRWNGSGFQAAGGFEGGPIDEVVALRVGNQSSSKEFTFMTSHEMADDEEEASWNCSNFHSTLVSWRRSESQDTTEQMDIPMTTLRNLKDEQEKLRKSPSLGNPHYQQALRYLQRPVIESQLGEGWQLSREKDLDPEEILRIRNRLLDTLQRQLQAEVNIIQLSIPESDLYDEHLMEDFLELISQLGHLHMETLPLPDTPSKVLAARSAQLIFPVWQEFRGMSENGAALQDQEALVLEQTMVDVLTLANHSGDSPEDEKLHAVIERLRKLQDDLPLDAPDLEESPSQQEELFLPLNWRPVQTLRLTVGSDYRPKVLYARLTHLADPEGPPPTTPSSAPAAHIQIHHVNGSLFQTLAAERGARHLATLRVRDETLLAFVEGCCRIRVLIYRGVQGFVPFAVFRAPRQGSGQEDEILQLLTLRLPLKRAPGALYSLAVVQSHRTTFYELVVAGLLEPWMKC
ncbi:uncharacterized protein fs(1)N [Drosophila bipectinata]|uniref:uncharacterized protein fs(1)N n=1 Tax=Drosophila bipectinata TaxID=42026 RepID=UPI001C8971C0|nr:uncharacterized protein LOC108124850 [Drosophila bipectinata]